MLKVPKNIADPVSVMIPVSTKIYRSHKDIGSFLKTQTDYFDIFCFLTDPKYFMKYIWYDPFKVFFPMIMSIADL